MPARTACCSAFQPLHAAVSRQFRDKPWRKWGGHTRSHTIDRFKNRASELNTPTQSNINKERVHFCCAMINHPTQYGCQKQTHQSEKEFRKDIPPTGCHKFQSGVPSGYPLLLPPSFLLLHLSFSGSPHPFCVIFLCLRLIFPPQLAFLCLSISNLSEAFQKSLNIFPAPPPPHFSRPLSTLSYLHSFLKHSGSLCFSTKGVGWNTNSQPTLDSKPKATAGRGHPPVAHRCSRDVPSMCVRLCAAVSMSYR